MMRAQYSNNLPQFGPSDNSASAVGATTNDNSQRGLSEAAAEFVLPSSS